MHALPILAALLLVIPSPASQTRAVSFESAVGDLESPDTRRRVGALRALREAGYVEAAVPVARLLTDPVEEVQVEAINAEVAFFAAERIRVRSRFGLIVEVRGASIAREAFDLGPAAVRPDAVPAEVLKGLLAATDAPGRRARVEAVYALGVLARPDAGGLSGLFGEIVAGVGARLGYQLPAQRVAAADVLARLFFVCGEACRSAGGDAVGDALVGALNDGSRAVQTAATAALGARRYERAIQALTDRLAHFRSGPMARVTLDALARVAHSESLTLFRARLVDRDPVLRRAAVEGIARLRDAAALAEVETAVGQDRADQVRLAAAFAQHRAGRADRLDDLVGALDDRNLRAQAAGYLWELGPTAAERLAGRLPSGSAAMRLEGARLLATIGTPAVVPAIDVLRADPDPHVAAAVVNAIAWIAARSR